MPRPKKTPEPAKRGPGRPRSKDPVRPRLSVPLTEERERAVDAYAARWGIQRTEVGERALDLLLAPDRAAEELAAWDAGRAAGLREAEADIARRLSQGPTAKPRIRAGDRVIAKDASASDGHLTYGQEYEVADTDGSGWVSLRDVVDVWDPRRFTVQGKESK